MSAMVWCHRCDFGQVACDGCKGDGAVRIAVHVVDSRGRYDTTQAETCSDCNGLGCCPCDLCEGRGESPSEVAEEANV